MRDIPTINPEAAMEKINAIPVVRYGLDRVIAPTWELAMVPDPRIMTAKAAPKAAAWEIPRVNGEPKGLRSTDCMTAPERDSPAPATIAASTWGRRMFQTMSSYRLATS